MFDKDALKELSLDVDAVVADLTDRLRKETLVGEESFTDRLIERLEKSINDKRLTYTVAPSLSYGSSSVTTTLEATRLDPARLVARSTIAKGRNSEEKLSGADAIVVLESSQPYIEAHKGILFQAKLHNAGGRFTSLGTREISDQCKRMLKVTWHAFAVVYSKHNVYCFPALEVNNQAWAGFQVSEATSVGNILHRFLSCEIGDYDLTAVDRKSFRKLVDKKRVRNGLLIKTK